MRNSNLYIFSESRDLTNSLSRFVRYYFTLNQKMPLHFDPQTHAFSIGNCKEINAVLDSISPSLLKDTMVVVAMKDLGPKNFKDPLDPKNHISRLVLRYPEVFWIFIGLDGFRCRKVFQWNCHFINLMDVDGFKNLIKLNLNGYRGLFDHSGFRAWLKHKIRNKLFKENDLFELSPLAGAVDEEPAYAYLHAYIAYRMGYRCLPVSTMEMFKMLFPPEKGQEDSKNCFNNERVELLFDDVFINFADRNDDLHLSRIKDRDKRFAGIRDIRRRIFVTIGHKHVPWAEETFNYITYLKGQGKAEIVYKPSGGIYNLLKEAKLLNSYKKSQKEKRSLAKKSAPIDSVGSGHSAPGVLLEIADALIERAEKIYSSALTVEDCIHGAVLATEAADILFFMTPTTTLEAIALRHKLEVKAECMFYGMQYNIETGERLRELREEVDALSKWVSPKSRKKAFLNAKMTIIAEISRLFREKGQFDEEQQCLRRLRKLNRDWFFLNHKGLFFLKPIRCYFEVLLGRLSYFLLAIILWPPIFGFISYILDDENNGIIKHLKEAFLKFYNININHNLHNTTNASQSVLVTPVNVFLQVGSYVHLGIFIAFLFHLIQRRT